MSDATLVAAIIFAAGALPAAWSAAAMFVDARYVPPRWLGWELLVLGVCAAFVLWPMSAHAPLSGKALFWTVAAIAGTLAFTSGTALAGLGRRDNLAGLLPPPPSRSGR